ncbi:hypothetical protein TNCV_96181 [Trichonephila clavipes]|nr:hypothetical protein TNCV_96181 [Trichonephila clavipes]
MPSCHSVHDLELAIKDLWAHLPQDNFFSIFPIHKLSFPSFLSGSTAQGGPWPSQEAFSRPAFLLQVFSNS